MNLGERKAAELLRKSAGHKLSEPFQTTEQLIRDSASVMGGGGGGEGGIVDKIYATPLTAIKIQAR